MITAAQLVACGIGPTQAKAFAEPLEQTCDLYEIKTTRRVAAFIAQCAHETQMFVHLEESLFYREPARIMSMFRNVKSLDQARELVGKPEALANVAYANRNGNGNEASGDGHRFRGRGCIQLTGRNNYTAAALKLAEPYIEKPDLVAEPGDACLTAGWFWDRNGLNRLADLGDTDGITRAINGSAMAGAQERRDLFARFFRVLTTP